MGSKAIGAYLRTLREARRLSRAAITQLIDVTESQIERIEKGAIDTRGTMLLQLADFFNGNLEHIKRLALTKNATEDDGKHLAQEWLASGQISTTALPQDLEKIVRELASDPRRFGQWIGYGQRLVDERDAYRFTAGTDDSPS